jgi:hypothetical protein
MCQLSSKDVSQACLNKKNKAKPIAKKKGKKTDSEDGVDEGEGPNKEKKND